MSQPNAWFLLVFNECLKELLVFHDFIDFFFFGELLVGWLAGCLAHEGIQKMDAL